MKRSRLIRFQLSLAAVGLGCAAPFLRASHNEVPAHGSLTEIARFGDQNLYTGGWSIVGHRGGLAVATDAAGSLYQAVGNRVAKYNGSGTLLWSQFQQPTRVSIVSGGLTQWIHYDRWEDDHGGIEDIQLASGYDETELARYFARKIVIDGNGDVIVGFLDLAHLDRSTLAKFDGQTGEVRWVVRTAPPHEFGSGRYVSDLVDLVVLPDNSVALLETGVGSGRWVFSRLAIFASQGSPSKMGVFVRGEADLVHREDGGASTRDSVGVGLAVDAGGNLYYATHEGAVPAEWPVFPNPFPTPDKLIIRKLVPPYTSSSMEVVHESDGVEHWCDLAVGPAGRIYVLGSDLTDRVVPAGADPEFDVTPVLASFDPFNLDENGFARKYYPATILPNFHGDEWEAWGTEIHVTGTDAGDSLYLVSGERDFRIWDRPILWTGFQQNGTTSRLIQPLSVYKVNAAGSVLWGRIPPWTVIIDSFIDESGHLYCLGDDGTISLTKYSQAGALQLHEEIPIDLYKSSFGRAKLTILPSGNVVVAPTQVAYMESPKTYFRIFQNPAIAPAPQTITYPSPIGDSDTNVAIPLDAYSSSGLSVSYRIVTGTGEIVGGNLYGRAGGLLEVEAFHAGNTDFLAASPVKVQYWILGSQPQKQTQTIEFQGLASAYRKKIGEKITLNASASSGLPVSFSTRSRKTITIKGSILTIRNYTAPTMTVTITANVPGNENYHPAVAKRTIRLIKPKNSRRPRR